MSRPSVKWAALVVSTLVTFVCFSVVFVLASYQAWLGISVAHAGQASSPDLVVSSLSNPPTSAVAGAVAISITDTTGNIGDGTANPSTTRYRLSVDNVITSADTLLTVTRSIPTLKKNSSSTDTVWWTIPANFTPGTYYLGACADDLSVITESNETNNCRVSTSTVQIYPPTSLTVTPTTVSAGVSVTATWTQIQSPTSTDWIGLYVPGAANNAYITYVYVNCTSTPTVAVPAGSCPFSIPFSVTPGTYELRLQWNGGFTTIATSNTFTVTAPPPPAKLAITSVNGGANPTAGAAFPVTVQVQGENGTPTIVSSATNVSLSLKSGTGTLGGTLAGTIQANSGQVTISGITYTKAESGVVLTATQTSGVSLAPGDSAPFAVNSGAAATLSFTTQPANGTAGATLSGPPTVVVQDSLGNNVTSVISVSIALGNNFGGAVLSGTTTKNTTSGLASFNDLSVNKSANGYTLIASATGLTNATSNPFFIGPGTATALAFLTQPNNATTGSAIPGPPTVVVRDNQGNTVTNSSASITIGIGTNPGGGTLSGTTVRNASGGVSAFADLKINQTGNGYTLTATSTGLTSATTSTFNVASGGSVAGTVSKATGGPISGASVQARQGGVVKGTASTNSGGNYTISGLSPGSYDIRVDAGGFSPQTQSGISVIAGSTATVNFNLPASSPTAGIVYIYDELQRLKSVIDPVGEAATYAYDAVGNLLSITRNTSSQTSIIDFNPNSGPVGNTVTIYGTGYSATPSQNSVTFNGVAATVVSSTLTQIVTTVPAGATNGPIAVTSPAGGATSATAFTVIGAPAGAPTIASFTPLIGAAGTTVTITGTNFNTTPENNEVHFNPTLAAVSNSTATNITATVPVSARSGKISVVTAGGIATSTEEFYSVPPPHLPSEIEYVGRMGSIGSGQTVTIPTAGKKAMLLFEGAVGQVVNLAMTGTTWCANYHIYYPDNSPFMLGGHYCGTQEIENFVIPSAGTYTIIVDPEGNYVGQATLTFSQDVLGTIVPSGASVNVNIPIHGQSARYTFTGSSGQRLLLRYQNPTFTCVNHSIIDPDGLLAVPMGFGCSTSFMDDVTLTKNGTHTILVDPSGAATGTETLTLFNVPPDATGSVSVDGPLVPVSNTSPGQDISVTFDGTAGQLLTLGMTNVSTGWGFVTIYKPDGTVLAPLSQLPSNGTAIDLPKLPVSGTYRIFIDPNNDQVGGVTLTLSQDITGTLPFGLPATNVSIPRAGQRARLTFSGTAGQKVTLHMTGTTIGNGIVTIFNPSLGSLTAGQKYDIKMEYFENTGNASAQLKWRSPSTAEQIIPQSQLYLPGGSTPVGLQGDYFNNKTYSGAPALTRTDATVDFNWGTGSPGAGVPSDNFSVRWTGQVEAQLSETYEFCTNTDHGSKLWINGVPIVDNPLGNACSTAPLTLASTSFWNGGGGGFLDTIVLPGTGTYTVLFDPNGTDTGNFSVTLYEVPSNPPASITANGPPVTAIASIPSENPSLTFAGTAGQTISLQMSGSTISSGTVTIFHPPLGSLTSGQKYDIKMEYRELGSNASAQLLWRSPSTVEEVIPQSRLYLPGGSTAVGLQGDYFNNNNLSGAPVLSRTDSTVNFSWGTGSPGAGVPSDNFSVRWTGQVEAQFSEAYEFCTNTDDGSRLWVNGLPIVDGWAGASKWCSTPNPFSLASTSIWNGGGGTLNNIELPVTGTYTIRVDPANVNVGEVTLTLINVP